MPKHDRPKCIGPVADDEILGARVVSEPESKPWNLHEFTAMDLDGNLLRVFYDFAWELAERGA
jgi:hypothetical protein